MPVLWSELTRNHHVARFGKHGSIEAVRPQRHDPHTREPRPWRIRVFGSYFGDSYWRLDDAKRAAEREVLREVVRLAKLFGVLTRTSGGKSGTPV